MEVVSVRVNLGHRRSRRAAEGDEWRDAVKSQPSSSVSLRLAHEATVTGRPLCRNRMSLQQSAACKRRIIPSFASAADVGQTACMHYLFLFYCSSAAAFMQTED